MFFELAAVFTGFYSPPPRQVPLSWSQDTKHFLKTLEEHIIKARTMISLDRSLGLEEVEAPRISRQSANEGGKVFSPKHRPSLPPGDTPGTHLC
jgi:hypothetical protein